MKQANTYDDILDMWISAWENPEDPKHEKIKTIMETVYDADKCVENKCVGDMLLQGHIKRRIIEAERERVARERKQFEENWLSRIEVLDWWEPDEQTATEIYKILEEWLEMRSSENYEKRRFADEIRRTHLVNYVGWAIPCRENVDLLFDWLQRHLAKFPQAKVIDWGCGTGIWTFLINQKGIPKENLMAVDVWIQQSEKKQDDSEEPEIEWFKDSYSKAYWEIIPKVETFDENDVLFVAWGRHGMGDAYIEEFVQKGGKNVIIVGEEDGCTTSSHLFRDDPEWNLDEKKIVAGAAYYCTEYMTFNTKK